MARGKLRFKERDVARALRAAAKSGVPTQELKITPDGTMRIILGDPAANELDRELAQFKVHQQ